MLSSRMKAHTKWHLKRGSTILMTFWILLTVVLLWPIIAELRNSHTTPKPPTANGANYLVIAPQSLEKSASAWAEYRRSTGYQTQVVLLTPDQDTVEEIRDQIEKTYTESGEPYPFFVLLIGHSHPLSSHPNTYLPAAHFSVDPSLSSGYGKDPIATDDGYGSDISGGISRKTFPIFIGRIPVRTEEEAFLLLERTQNYERIPPAGDGRARIELISSNAGFGPQYDPIFEWALRTLLQQVLPDEYQWHMLNGNAKSPFSYPIELFPTEMAKRFDSGALAMVYIGHGQPDMLCCAYSLDGEPDRIFSFEDAELIRNASASLGIFTACSAGTYDLAGDNLSVVESIYLTWGGPVATYSSSAWINGAMSGRLLIDIFEALLVDKASTLGEWMYRVEYGSDPTDSRLALIALLKGVIPRLSGMYENKPWLSPSEARQVLDIQYATYNLFGDPALRIAYPQPGLEIHPSWLWQPWRGSLSFSGKSDLQMGQEVSVSMETLPGELISQEDDSAGTIDGYLHANKPIIEMVTTSIQTDGNFSGRMILPSSLPSGKYLLRAVSIKDNYMSVTTRPVYIGWPPVLELFSSAVFWWFLIGILFLYTRLTSDRSR